MVRYFQQILGQLAEFPLFESSLDWTFCTDEFTSSVLEICKQYFKIPSPIYFPCAVYVQLIPVNKMCYSMQFSQLLVTVFNP